MRKLRNGDRKQMHLLEKSEIVMTLALKALSMVRACEVAVIDVLNELELKWGDTPEEESCGEATNEGTNEVP